MFSSVLVRSASASSDGEEAFAGAFDLLHDVQVVLVVERLVPRRLHGQPCSFISRMSIRSAFVRRHL
jgi:hypothetical protein